MLQKYRLAVALAILRNKPNNISVENYITELQSKIRGSELDETLSNIDVDEEDFNLSDGLNTVSVDLNEENSNDSITILQNYDLAGLENEDQNSLADVLQILDNYEKNQALESTTNCIEKPYIEINSHLENEYQICSENAIKNSILKINQPIIPDSGAFIRSNGRQYQNSVNERNIVNENKEVNERNELINERNTVNGRNLLIHERNAANGRDGLILEGNTVNESTKVNERNTFESDSDTEIMKDLSDSQAEVIPFKVMEELNKIKIYLNKRNRIHSESHGTDSGYKSNSRESYLTASQSSLWLNQSSHCLFSYLSQCPLLVSTMEINYEVAKVLGLLIDRLHDDEKYPTFLEEMLEFIDKLLHNIYNGDFDDENVFLKNDESIDRLILLNKSQNIIKFTIEKITKLLENFHERLEKGSHVELENINTAENLCFIFHLLEVLLKKHTTNLSQTSQQSQNEKILKRSTLTEIWRKKWNLTQAEVYHKQEKRDVIVMCSDVLNKIIVKSMENYSLVAFAALQCFNLLQS
ncbi:uncharacterized protein LOC123704532 [Colias croceus]|uniref:uncharacterized protein LOC123704532 n=1 Tax=Colias crocea TaxID=72248 RepID=UPI001E27A6C0|nr:uncharacterized protein LOC123704532 [Colias croceus]